MDSQKKQMQEVAILYYEKKYTQQKIAQIMNLSRQTVSKLLNEAINEKIVEIKIYDPETTCKDLEEQLCKQFKIKNAIVSGVSHSDKYLRQLMTVKKAIDYILTLIEAGNKKIGISWGRTIEMFIDEFPSVFTQNNTVFPLFGATDQEQSYFLSNELARNFASRTNSKIKYAWFPYLPDCKEDCNLFKKTSYYKNLTELWDNIDIAIVGIGNSDIIQTFGKIFGYNENSISATGDISTHFFNSIGEFVELYENTLCASIDNLKNAKQTIAIASGDSKVEAIIGALHTQIINTLITDEYTAKKILKKVSQTPKYSAQEGLKPTKS